MKHVSFTTPTDRKRFAEKLSLMIECAPGDEVNGLPYEPNKDSWYYQLDTGNDWHVSFFDDDPYSFDIRYRYNVPGKDNREVAFAQWFCTRFKHSCDTDPKMLDFLYADGWQIARINYKTLNDKTLSVALDGSPGTVLITAVDEGLAVDIQADDDEKTCVCSTWATWPELERE